MKLKTRKLYSNLTILLLVVLPINYMVFNILLKSFTPLKYVKDLLMISIILLYFFVKKNRACQKKRYQWPLIVSLLIALIVATRIITSTNTADSLYASRLIIVPLIFYYIYLSVDVTEQLKQKIINVIFILTIALAVWGIFQAYILRDSFLIRLNYKGTPGRLSHGFYISGYRGIQRVTGTFAAPNLMAMYLNFVLFLLISQKKYIKYTGRIYQFGIIIITIASVLTFSRTGWIGLTLGWVYHLGKQHKITRKRLIRVFFVVLALVVIGIIIIQYSDNVRNAFSLLIKRTLAGTDSSLISHTDSLTSTIDLIFVNLIGYYWLGYNGPRTRLGVINYNVESSLLLIGLELGIIGLILYVMYFGSIVSIAKKETQGEGLISAFLAIIPSLLFLPLIYEYELITFIFVIIAIFLNPSTNRTRVKFNEHVKIV